MPQAEAGTDKGKKKGGGGNKKGNGTKARHKFVKPDGRSINVILTEAKGKLTVRATLSHPSPGTTTETDPETNEAIEVKVPGEKQIGRVKQFDLSERKQAEEYFASVVADCAEKGWLSRKTGAPASAFDEIPE